MGTLRRRHDDIAPADVIDRMISLLAHYGWNENDFAEDRTGTHGLSVCGAYNRACGSGDVFPVEDPLPARRRLRHAEAAAWAALFTPDLLDGDLWNDWHEHHRSVADIVVALRTVRGRLDARTCAHRVERH